MRVYVTSVFVDDQDKALKFYTGVLGFVKKTEIPLGVDDVPGEVERLRTLGVDFTQEALKIGPVTTAVLDDTCGNLIQIVSHQ
jgi:predicted enzyme related to lactoylglutathione lyase